MPVVNNRLIKFDEYKILLGVTLCHPSFAVTRGSPPPLPPLPLSYATALYKFAYSLYTNNLFSVRLWLEELNNLSMCVFALASMRRRDMKLRENNLRGDTQKCYEIRAVMQ